MAFGFARVNRIAYLLSRMETGTVTDPSTEQPEPVLEIVLPAEAEVEQRHAHDEPCNCLLRGE